jgi:UDP-3-O-[3-hydroxymyristoyl] glucosamine N-acyltransferase
VEIAERLGAECVDGADVAISGLATLQNAGPDDLSFFTQARFRPQLATTRAAAVIVSRSERNATPLPRIVCADAYLGYASAAELLFPPPEAVPGIHPGARVEAGASVHASAEIGFGCHVAAGAEIGARVILGAGCTIGPGARVAADTRLHANVAVYAGCVLGERVIVHSGAVIGADGFGMAQEGGRWRKIPQVGRVVVGNDVEIGANTTIDRGALDDTVIEDGVKLDNQIQVGHNVRIGAHSALAGCVGIAGSARIGRRCTIGGGAVILGHLELADDVHVSAATVVTRSVRQPGEYAGLYPMQARDEWARNAVLLKNLQRLAERVRALEARGNGRRDAARRQDGPQADEQE